MKVLHVTFTYHPDPSGGTEVYVAQLCRRLNEAGIENVVAAPGPADRQYVVDGTVVRRFACVPEHQTLETLYGGGDPIATASFERVLSSESPDVVHQHALSPACSVELIRCARQRGIPVVFTVHTPAVFCQRGALLRWGKYPCDVAWSTDACTPCVIDGLGTGQTLARVASAVPSAVGRVVERGGRRGGLWTAVRLPALMEQRIAAVNEVFARATRVVSLSQWSTDVLERNGVPPGKIEYVPHGIDMAVAHDPDTRNTTEPVRFVHLGRLDPVKGTLLVARALASAPNLAATLDIYGIGQPGDADTVERDIRHIEAADSRIRLHPAVPSTTIVDVLSRYDALLVPSQSAETGPLVVLEAFAARVPVIGSHVPGISEKVRHEENGLLVSPFDAQAAWARALHRCTDERGLLSRLRDGITPPRSMADVAGQMRALYDRVVTPAVAGS